MAIATGRDWWAAAVDPQHLVQSHTRTQLANSGLLQIVEKFNARNEYLLIKRFRLNATTGLFLGAVERSTFPPHYLVLSMPSFVRRLQGGAAQRGPRDLRFDQPVALAP